MGAVVAVGGTAVGAVVGATLDDELATLDEELATLDEAEELETAGALLDEAGGLVGSGVGAAQALTKANVKTKTNKTRNFLVLILSPPVRSDTTVLHCVTFARGVSWILAGNRTISG